MTGKLTTLDIAVVVAYGRLLPDASCIGASASGNLYEGNITTEKLVVTCTVFEKPESFVRTRLIPVENRDASMLRETLHGMKDAFSGVKGVEIKSIAPCAEGVEATVKTTGDQREALFLAAAKAGLPVLELAAERRPLDALLEGLTVERFEGGGKEA